MIRSLYVFTAQIYTYLPSIQQHFAPPSILFVPFQDFISAYSDFPSSCFYAEIQWLLSQMYLILTFLGGKFKNFPAFINKFTGIQPFMINYV